MKRTALNRVAGRAAPRTLHPDSSAHQLYEPARNGEPQAGAPIFPCGGGIRLLESAEDDTLFFGCDSDAGIGYREVTADSLGRRPFDLGPHQNFTPGSELDGIAHQVYQDLAQPAEISAHHLGEAGRGLEPKFQTPLSG